MNQDTLSIERMVDAPVEKVWQAITDQNQMSKWYFPDIDFEPVVGHITQFNVHHEGKDFLHIWEVTEVQPLKKIAYNWRYSGYPGISLLSFDLKAVDDKTQLTLTHKNLNSFDPVQTPELSSQNFITGWEHFMDGLNVFLKY